MATGENLREFYTATVLDVVIELVVRDSDIGRLLKLFLHVRNLSLIDVDLGSLSELTNEIKLGLVDQTAREPQEGLLEVVIGAGGEIVVLQVALAVELDVLGLDLSVLDVDLVADQHNRDVLADTNDISVPVRNVLVGDTRSDIKHNDGALALDVVTVTKTTEFFLAGGIPHVENLGQKKRANTF